MIKRIMLRLWRLLTRQKYWVRKIPPTAEDVCASGGGERQAAPSLRDIRPDHISRYEFACRFIMEGSRVLDIACGVGYGTNMLATNTLCENVLGVDVSSEALAYAQDHYASTKIRYQEGKCPELNLEEGSIDIAVSLETIEHIQDDNGFLQLLCRTIASGGRLVISCPNEVALPYGPDSFDFHVRHYTPEQLTELLSINGFRVDETYSQPSAQVVKPSKGVSGNYLLYVCTRV